MGPIELFLGWGLSPKTFLGLSIYTNNFRFLSIALFSFFHVVCVCGGWGGVGWFLVINVSHQTFCCVQVSVVVEVGVGL